MIFLNILYNCIQYRYFETYIEVYCHANERDPTVFHEIRRVFTRYDGVPRDMTERIHVIFA